MSARSFLTVITDILIDKTEIPELPMNKLIASEKEGSVVEVAIRREVFLKMARLQTLLYREYQNGTPPDLKEIEQIAFETGSNPIQAMNNALKVSRDAKERIAFLERLIIEVVRENFPKEREVFDVSYVAHLQGKIVRLRNKDEILPG